MSTELDSAPAVTAPAVGLVKARWWRLAWLGSAVAFVVALGAIAPHLGSGADLVRLRNALLIDFGSTALPDWQPPATPRGFRTDGSRIDPYFAAIARELRLAEMATDWDRSVAISEHLLGKGTRPRTEQAARASLQETHLAIVRAERGYCADYVRVFTAIANAAGMTVRQWAFSFDGFGGHGHVWPEVWNRQRRAWELVGIFNNNYFTLDGAGPLSALELRQALLRNAPGLAMHRLDRLSPPGMPREDYAWSYYRRGLKQWYLWWGNDVFTYDSASAVRVLRPLSRPLEQLGAIATGVHPRIRVLRTPDNEREFAAMERLFWELRALTAAALALSATSVLWGWSWLGQRRRRAEESATRPSVPAAGAGQGVAADALPCIAVYSSLFPHAGQPTAGLFIRERMFRMRLHAPIVVVSPQPWFPLQSLIRRFVPGYRPPAPRVEVQDGVTVHFPRFLSVPGALRWLDGASMALCTLPLMRRLRRDVGVGIIDAHFAYPCGDAAVRLGRWLGLPVSVTLRGTETRQLATPRLRERVVAAASGATRVFSVSESLRAELVAAGVDGRRIHVVGNGVDLQKFHPVPRDEARAALGLPAAAPVLVSVGGLVDRKGFHRVIELLPALREAFPDLRYLVVGGPSPEGDNSAALRAQVARLGLEEVVTFTGAVPPGRLKQVLGAADVFVLATANEGWANVFLEAMACGLPVVTTDVGGNAEVVCDPSLGLVVPFGDTGALRDAIAQALRTNWDRRRIVAHAQSNTWDGRIALLEAHFREMVAQNGRA